MRGENAYFSVPGRFIMRAAWLKRKNEEIEEGLQFRGKNVRIVEKEIRYTITPSESSSLSIGRVAFLFLRCRFSLC